MQDSAEVRTRESASDPRDRLLTRAHRGVILLKVLEYLAYKVQYADFNAADITEDFSTRIDPYIALEL